jgi:hypothetical protein
VRAPKDARYVRPVRWCGPLLAVDELIAVRASLRGVAHLAALLPTGVILCGDSRVRFDRVTPALGEPRWCSRCQARLGGDT